MLNLFMSAVATVGVARGAHKLRLAHLPNRLATIDAKKIEFNADLRRSCIQAAQFNR